MIYADFRFFPVSLVNSREDAVMVAHQSRHVMPGDGPDFIPAVVSEIMDYQVEIVHEQRPEGKIEIDSQTVAVTQDKPRTGRIPVPAHGNNSVGVRADFTNGSGFWYLPQVF